LEITVPNELGVFEMYKIYDTHEFVYDKHPVTNKFISLIQDKVVSVTDETDKNYVEDVEPRYKKNSLNELFSTVL
jgi:hypothetical protein